MFFVCIDSNHQAAAAAIKRNRVCVYYLNKGLRIKIYKERKLYGQVAENMVDWLLSCFNLIGTVVNLLALLYILFYLHLVLVPKIRIKKRAITLAKVANGKPRDRQNYQ